MTKLMGIFCLIILASCAHNRGPASVDGHPVAYDSMALGNVQASAVKRESNKEICFDINLKAKDVKSEQAQATNWTMAWVDSQGKYHLVPVTQRNPASAPQGGAVVAPYGAYNEFSNDFTSCISNAQYSDIKGLVLTPKELPYPKKDGMHLTWKE